MATAAAMMIPDAADLVARAEALVPVLRSRADACEAGNKVPDETIRDFQDAGFFKILQPKRFGGYEMDPEAFYAVQMKVAEGCMSSAWVLGVVAVHNWQLALFDPKAQDDVWGDDPTTLISSSYMPRAQVTPVDGGYRIRDAGAFPAASIIANGRFWAVWSKTLKPVSRISGHSWSRAVISRFCPSGTPSALAARAAMM